MKRPTRALINPKTSSRTSATQKTSTASPTTTSLSPRPIKPIILSRGGRSSQARRAAAARLSHNSRLSNKRSCKALNLSSLLSSLTNSSRRNCSSKNSSSSCWNSSNSCSRHNKSNRWSRKNSKRFNRANLINSTLSATTV